MIKSTRFRMVKLLYNMVRFYPEGNYFAPFGKKSSEIEEIEVRVDEIEAIRLKDGNFMRNFPKYNSMCTKKNSNSIDTAKDNFNF